MPTLRIRSTNENIPHFITITAIDWIELFIGDEYFRAALDCFEYCRSNCGLLLYEYVIMKDHIHIIASAAPGFKLSRAVGRFKQYSTRKLLMMFERDGRTDILNTISSSDDRKKGYHQQIWKRENYPEPVATEMFYRKHAEYIWENPFRKGYVENMKDWPYSSARNRFFEDDSIIELDNIIL